MLFSNYYLKIQFFIHSLDNIQFHICFDRIWYIKMLMMNEPLICAMFCYYADRNPLMIGICTKRLLDEINWKIILFISR